MKIKEYQDIASQIKDLYTLMDKENDKFSKLSGLSCVSTCNGVCCSNKDVAVPPVDLIPLALELIAQNNYLQYLTETSDTACFFFKNGKCSVYQNRATLCRLFAYSSVYNKNGQKQLSVCSYIKEKNTISIDQDLINQAANIVDWSAKITNLLPNWDSSCKPFNQSLRYALEKILLSYQYEEQG